MDGFVVLASQPAGQLRAIRVGAICDVCPIPAGTRLYFVYATVDGHAALDVREPFPTVLTLLQLASERPIAWSDEAKAALDALG